MIQPRIIHCFSGSFSQTGDKTRKGLPKNGADRNHAQRPADWHRNRTAELACEGCFMLHICSIAKTMFAQAG